MACVLDLRRILENTKMWSYVLTVNKWKILRSNQISISEQFSQKFYLFMEEKKIIFLNLKNQFI